MKISQNSNLGHPVLISNEDLHRGSPDFVDGSLKIEEDSFNYVIEKGVKIDIDFIANLDQKEIEKLINSGDAEAFVMIESQRTLKRVCQPIKLGERKTITFPYGELMGDIPIYVFISTCRDISNYTSPSFNDDFQQNLNTFDVDEGKILAISNTIPFEVKPDTNNAKYWAIEEDEDLEEKFGVEVTTDLTADIAKIIVSKKFNQMFKSVKGLGGSVEGMQKLKYSLYLHCFTHAIEKLEEDDYKELNWNIALASEIDRLHKENPSLNIMEANPFVKAQHILGNPYRYFDDGK